MGGPHRWSAWWRTWPTGRSWAASPRWERNGGRETTGHRGGEIERTWPDFFRWLASGATFELVSLDVTAGDRVAYAHALLRCGTAEDFARQPELRLRLTFGLLKEDGRWIIAHEHHSFPADPDTDDREA